MNVNSLFPSFRRSFPALLTILLLLAIGIYARTAELSWHFSNNDDLRGVRRILIGSEKAPRIFAIPAQETNAPFQFLFTTFLVSPEQGYRELLFWGRLPSCIAGILALFTMILFYRRWENPRHGAFPVALALLAFSWENIAYAKQTYSYAIGVFALMMLLFLLTDTLRLPSLSLRRILGLSFALALFCNMQYQMHLLVPAFYLILLMHQWSRRPDKSRLVTHLAAGAALFGLLMAPTWYFFMWDKLVKGATGTGSADMSPQLIPEASWLSNAYAFILFYVRNFFMVFRSKLGFTPEGSLSHQILSWIFYSFFLIAWIKGFFSKERQRKFLSAFFLLSIAAWWILTGFQKLSFGVSRHTLILLPFFAVLTGEGFAYSALKAASFLRLDQERFCRIAGLLFTLFLTTLFLYDFPTFLRERRDLMDEQKFMEIFRKYDPEILVYNNETFGFDEMKEVQTFFEQKQVPGATVETVAIASRYRFTPEAIEMCDVYRNYYNMQKLKSGNPESMVQIPCRDFEMLFSWIHPSNVQTDFSRTRQVQMYSNSLYFYIFRKKGLPAVNPVSE